MFPRTQWQTEVTEYTARLAALILVTPEVEAQLNRFPGLMGRYSSDLVAVKHRTLIFANHSLSSANELLQSVKLLWTEGHHLAAGHCVRLLFEVWGSLLFAQTSVLKKAAESAEGATTADARLQKLLMGTNSRPLLPAGMLEEIKVIHVGKFKEAGEMAAPGFKATYAFLCDISHPTYMHSFFYWLTLDSAWTNQLWAQEMHRIWDELIKAAERAVGGICAGMIEIYDDCLPDIEKGIASSAPKL
jgi:hypothetical protein